MDGTFFKLCFLWHHRTQDISASILYRRSSLPESLPLEVVSRYSDPQPQVVETDSYLFNLRSNIYKYWCLNTHFIPDNSVLIILYCTVLYCTVPYRTVPCRTEPYLTIINNYFLSRDTMSSRTTQIKEGLNRLCCLVPYDVVVFEVSESVCISIILKKSYMNEYINETWQHFEHYMNFADSTIDGTMIKMKLL